MKNFEFPIHYIKPLETLFMSPRKGEAFAIVQSAWDYTLWTANASPLQQTLKFLNISIAGKRDSKSKLSTIFESLRSLWLCGWLNYYLFWLGGGNWVKAVLGLSITSRLNHKWFLIFISEKARLFLKKDALNNKDKKTGTTDYTDYTDKEDKNIDLMNKSFITQRCFSKVEKIYWQAVTALHAIYQHLNKVF